MKSKNIRLFACSVTSVLALSSSAFADTQYWDGTTNVTLGASDNTTTAAQNWLSGGNWDNGTTSAPLASWTSGDSAIFGGSAASQTITAGTLTIGNMTFGSGAAGLGTTGTAYTISGGAISLQSGSTITTNTDTTISTNLSGSGGSLTKEGAGTLTLTGNSSFTGLVIVNEGTLNATNYLYSNLSATAGLVVNSGATAIIGVKNQFTTNHNTGMDNAKLLTINNGTLVMSSTTDSRFGNVTLNDGSIWTSNRALTGYGALLGNTSTGAATVKVTGTGASTMNGTGGIFIQGVQNFDVADVTGDSAADLIVNMVLSTQGQTGGAAGGINKTGAGTMELNAANTYTGGTTIRAGSITVGNNSAFGTGTVNLAGGAMTVGGRTITNALVAAASTTSNISYGSDATLKGSLTGSGTVNIAATSASSLSLNGDMSGYTGVINVDNAKGNVFASNGLVASSNTGSTAAAFTVNNGGSYAFAINLGTFDMGSLAGNGRVTAYYNSAQTSTLSVGALNTDTTFSGVLNNNGSGVLALSKKGTGTQTLTGTNTYTGVTTITAGTLQLGDGTTGKDGTITSASVVNNANLTFNRFGPSSYSGVISGSGSVTKTGAGTQTLTGTNTYIGTTTIKTGTLYVNGNISTSSLTTVESAATLGGTGTAGKTVVDAGGFIAPGITGVGNLSVVGDLSIAGTYSWQLGALSTANPGTNFDQITMTSGNANITGATLSLALGAFAPSGDLFWQTDQTWGGILSNTGPGTLTGSFAAIDNSAWLSYGTFSTMNSGNDVNLLWTAIPEPSSALLGTLGSLMLLRRRRYIFPC